MSDAADLRAEVALSIFRVFARTDEDTARQRFERMHPAIRERWEREAQAAINTMERYHGRRTA